MGSNNKKKQETVQRDPNDPNMAAQPAAMAQQPTGPVAYGPNAGISGTDPRGRSQNMSQYQQQRFENMYDPMMQQLATGYGNANQMDQANYADIMNQYRNVGADDPFKSYGGYEEFSQTGGYSPVDIANMRARGTAPVTAAYANAQREMGRNRALQGGYSPNAAASIARMAREQGQAGADAMQGVEAGLATARNQGRLAGLSGMAGIEGQRKQAQLNALQGMGSLYGTTPGMSNMFGNQLMQGIQMGGQFGLNLMGQDIQGQRLPGAYDTTMGRINDVANMAYPWLDRWKNSQQTGQPTDPSGQTPPIAANPVANMPGSTNLPQTTPPPVTPPYRPPTSTFPQQNQMYKPGPIVPFGVQNQRRMF